MDAGVIVDSLSVPQKREQLSSALPKDWTTEAWPKHQRESREVSNFPPPKRWKIHRWMVELWCDGPQSKLMNFMDIDFPIKLTLYNSGYSTIFVSF